MAGMHPSEIELLELAEGELEGEEREAVGGHVDDCPSCSARIAELERARTVLRASPLFELSERRRDAILASLPRRERERSPLAGLLAPKRLAAILVPVAAVVVAVVALTTTGGPGDEREAVEAGRTADLAATAEAQAAPEAGGAEAASPAETAPLAESAMRPVVSVTGPAADVAKLLEEQGFTVTIAGPERVEVTGATERQVRQALESVPGGPVQVFVLPG
jgi:anti-sigma factor ChrR (cupin superfamily)